MNYALNDLLGYQSAAKRLLSLDPREHDLQPALARARCRRYAARQAGRYADGGEAVYATQKGLVC